MPVPVTGTDEAFTTLEMAQRKVFGNVRPSPDGEAMMRDVLSPGNLVGLLGTQTLAGTLLGTGWLDHETDWLCPRPFRNGFALFQLPPERTSKGSTGFPAPGW